jgi:AcrR family transcriptional regulator
MRASKKTVRRTQQERREATRRLLIEAAIDCICEFGFAASTLDAITARAGVTRGAVQHHFGTGDELLLAVVEDLNEKLSALADAGTLAGRSLAERLASVCYHLWETLSSRHFVAAIQIQLGTVTDPLLSQRVLKIMVKIENDLDRQWMQLFAADDIAPARIVTARHVAQAALRGLAIKQIYRKRRNKSEAERALLLDMLRHAFRSERKLRLVR